MNFIDIACMRSIAFSTQCDLKSEPILPIGEIGENKYWSYLYFNLQFAYISEIYKAELVLYKIPNQSSNKQVRRRKNRPQRIVVIPTNDYVSLIPIVIVHHR
ncbi:hypothetical protein [Cellulosilyticum ruminicola]|uniref:hypothetical protein n=1 Tax=Cellulosilyticum ruminicola TaxID=425254 RepID=UPI0006D1385D|nr:hypothetical protein [Cellulosilyticum ruminicola]